ncbi:MAG: hypothetical protein Q9224_005729 [Gallowayella concinna]
MASPSPSPSTAVQDAVTTGPPEISITLSISPNTYHFSDPTPPKLSLAVASNADRPLTIFTFHRILNPHLALAQRRFVLTDLTDGLEVPQTNIKLQRPAFARMHGHPDEEYYLEILPGVSTIVSTAFARGDDDPPQPKAIVQRGVVLDENGNETTARRSKLAQGVDGLEAGHRYRLDVASGGFHNVWWRWGTKEENLMEPDSADRMLRQEQSEKATLVFTAIEGIEFSVED